LNYFLHLSIFAFHFCFISS